MADLADIGIRVDASQLERLNQILDKVSASAERNEQDLVGMGRAISQLNRITLPAVGAMSRFDASTRRSAAGLSRFGQVAQQSGYQIGDFIVQVQSGTNAWVAAGQQLTQLAGLLYLSNTAWMITAGTIASITIPLITAFGAYISRTKEAEESTKGFDNALKGLREGLKDIEAPYLQEAYGLASDQELAAVREILDLQTKGKALRAEVLALESSNLSAKRMEGEERRAELEELVRKIDLLNATREQYAAYRQQLETAAAIHQGMMAREDAHYRVIGQQEADRIAKANQYNAAMVATQSAHQKVQEAIQIIHDRIGGAKLTAEQLSKIGFGNFDTAAASALRIAANLGIALSTAQALANLGPQGIGGNDPSGGTYSGRGRGPTDGELAEMRASGNGWIIPPSDKKGGGGGGSGGGSNPIEQELETLRSFLMEADEIEKEEYQKRQDTLRAALDQRMLTLEEYNTLEKELKIKHNEELASIDALRYGNALTQAEFVFGELASAAQAGGQKYQKIYKAFAIGEALITGYKAAVSAWEKGMTAGGPGLAAAYTALSLAKTGGLIAGMRSGSSSSGGSSRGSVGRVQSTAAPSPQTVYVSGLDPNALFTGEMISNLFENFYQENDNRGKVFVVAR